ncbi:MAG: leucine-rich repeat domain-containing protein [Clostridia bacterium]|nr:leucine-rich repeat domain-containing protein [Clostridia bacterium]
MKRLIYILLVLSIIFALVGCNAAPKAEAPGFNDDDNYPSDFPQDNASILGCFEFEWNEEYGGYFVYENDDNRYIDLVIPSEYKGKPVVGIGKYAFNSYAKVRTVIIPKSIQVIDSFAFSYCDYLQYIEFENGSTLRMINDYAFNNCKILSRIDVPAGVERIGYRAFSTCPMLSKINVDNQSVYYCTINDCVYSKDMTTLVVVVPTYSEKEFIVPEGVVDIMEGAFRDCDNIESIVIPSTVKALGDNLIGAFLKEINFAGTIEEWGTIEKGAKWDEKAKDYIVVCTNGTIEKGE